VLQSRILYSSTGLAVSIGLLESKVQLAQSFDHATDHLGEAEPHGEETKTAVRAVDTGERKDRVLIVEDEDNARKGYEQLLQNGVMK